MTVTVPTLQEVGEILKRDRHAEFQADSVRALGGPIVYAWVRGEEVLYIGLGAYGLARPLSRNHHRLLGMQPGDRLIVWCWEAEEQAVEAERQLVLRLRPPLNDSPVPPAPARERKLRRTLAVNEMLEPKFMAAEEIWTTVEETARLLSRAPQTIRNLISKHELPRRIVPQGRSKRRVMLLSYQTREKLRTLCWGEEAGF